MRFRQDLRKSLGKSLACNSRDFLRVRYEIRQTYAVCLILLFMRRVTLRYPPWRRLAYLRSSVLANKMDGSFAKIGTIDYHYWAKRKTFLLANRNHSICKQKQFYLQVETILFAGRNYETWKNQEKRIINSGLSEPRSCLTSAMMVFI